jgi:hypothetical protein
MKHALWMMITVGSTALLASTTGCSGDGAQDDPAQQGALVEFQDRFGSHGQLTVVRDDRGNLGMLFADSITDAPATFHSELVGKSLVDLYEALHPGTRAPTKLQALSKEFLSTQGARPAGIREESEAPIDKDLSSFNATVCKNLPGDSFAWYWKKISCGFQPHPGSPPAAFDYYTGDIAAGWNETAGSAYHENSNSSWKPIIPPYTYYWTQWNMRYEGAVIEMRPYDILARDTGYYGVTVHRKTSNARPLP